MIKENGKEKFIDELKKSGGIIFVACGNAGISRATYYRWLKSDKEFAEQCEEVIEAQIDHVESKLMALINAGDNTSTIFYLKTRGKKRGWSEKVPQEVQQTTPTAIPIATPVVEEKSTDFARKVKSKKNYIVKLLKGQGKYTAELSMQVNITAQLLVRTESLADEILSEGHNVEEVELSREGHTRKSISPKEKLYLDFVQQSQRALRALGMNTDSKERKADNDVFGDFINQFKND